jgi:hypothetical protein
VIIYLYKKTHNITGLKYLGKTTQDPFKYKGSGTYWSNHINKHGYDVTTEVLKECQSVDELKEWGIYYSDLWNIVESKEWANIRPESGDGGDTSKTPNYKSKRHLFSRKGELNPRYKHGNLTKEAIEARKKENPLGHRHFLGKKRPEISGGKHYEAKPVHTPLGDFDTITQASKSHNVTRTIITRRIKKYPSEYYYLR